MGCRDLKFRPMDLNEVRHEIYCLRNTNIRTVPYGLPELLASAAVIGLQAWKRNTLLSILSGTAAYMLMIQLVF